jgi:hypothetical protein
MIPEFDERGYLPPGLHKATIEEIEQRFGRQSELRRVQMESLQWLFDLLRGERFLKIVINGSFTTDEYEPNDIDCVILMDKDDFLTKEAEQKIVDGLPFLDIDIVTQEMFDFYVKDLFSTDRRRTPKGMIEVI